ncbi:MAG: acetyl-CoA carboxylase biotin carboxyl carrier protein [Phycisphaeraceae bacterium]|nr:MAG: acetyl-CoA carboxylase biotin carboxyl carrier protein [Phycisphaeraceae bacterium]
MGHEMIEVEQLQTLIKLMVDNDLSELDLRDSDRTITIKRGGVAPPAVHAAPAAPPPAQASGTSAEDAQKAATAAADAGLVAIESPMVGTFYSAANPDSPAFVSVGSSVGPDSVICLIEAMKVFNEVKAECAGTIERILVNNGDAVEFGQKLFMVRPA